MNKWYINNVEISQQVGTTLIETLDETLDRGSIILSRTGVKTPYSPETEIMLNADGIYYKYKIIEDKVRRISHSPNVYYEHNISFSQNTFSFQYHILRNTQVSQSIINEYSSKNYWTMCVLSQNGNYYADDRTTVVAENNLDKLSSTGTYGGLPVAFPYYNSNLSTTFSLPSGVLLDQHIKIVCKFAGFGSNSVFDNRVGYPYEMSFDSPTATKVYIGGHLWRTANRTDGVFFDNDIIDLSIPSLDGYTIQQNVNYTLTYMPLSYYNETEQWVLPYPYTQTSSGDSQTFYINAYCTAIIEYKSFSTSLYDTISRLRIICPLEEYSKVSSTRLFEVSQHLKGLTENIPSPQFTFSSCTLYQALAECLQVIDGIPFINGDGELDVEFFNDYSNEKSFDNITQYESSLNAKDYVNKYVSELQNATTNNTIFFPSKDSVRQATTGTTAVVDLTNMTMDLSAPIEKLVHFNILCQASGTDGAVYPIDIAGQCITSDIYKSLPYAQTQFYLVYEKGGTSINIGTTYQNEYFKFLQTYTILGIINRAYGETLPTGLNGIWKVQMGVALPDYNNFCYQVEYIARDNLRVQVNSPSEKYEGEIFTNQGNSNVIVERVGNNMHGLIARSGNEEITITQRITNFANRLKKGDYYLIDNELYVVNVVQHKFHKNGLIVSNCQLSKNFNKISNRTQIDISKRLSLISSTLGTNAEDFYNDYYTISCIQGSTPQPLPLAKNTAHFNQAFSSTFSQVFSNEAVNYRWSISNKPNLVCFRRDSNSTRTYINMYKIGVGNTMQFHCFYKDKINAGFYIKNGTSSPYPYTTLQGDFSYATLTGYGLNTSNSSYKYHYFYNNANTPIVDENNISQRYVPFFTLNSLWFSKDPNETFAVNYCIGIVPENPSEIVVGSALSSDNWCISNTLTTIKTLGSSTNYINFAETDFSNWTYGGVQVSKTMVGTTSEFFLTITGIANIKSIAFLNKETGRLLLGVNNLKNNNKLIIYFFATHNRI